MATDAAFAAEVEFQKMAAEAVRAAERLRLKNLLREEDRLMDGGPAKKIPATARVVRLNPIRYWAAAASLIAVAFCGWWLFLRETPEKLFATEFSPYENILTHQYPTLAQRETAMVKTDVGEAFSLLETQKYPEAAAAFAALAASKNEPRFRFWQGQALAAGGKTKEALDLFAPFAADSKSEFYSAAHWNIALAHLRAGDKVNARNWLEKIGSDPLVIEKKEEAAALLRKLD